MKYTIIVTVYNKEKYISRCLDSVCNQTFNQYEVLVVNDGSNDSSDKIIKKYQKKYKFKYIKKENTGVADTRNMAIKEVKTKYFLFVDADDYISIDLLETVDKYDNYDVLSFNAINLDESLNVVKNITKIEYIGNGETFFTFLVNKKSEFTVPWGYVYNTLYFKKNNFKYPKGKILEDFYLTPFILMSAENVISINYVGYYYINIQSSIINSSKNQALICNTYIEHYSELKKIINDYNYDRNTKRVYLIFISGILLWYGSKLTNKQNQKIYAKKIISMDIFHYVKHRNLKKILVNLNIYYPLRKLLKRGKYE